MFSYFAVLLLVLASHSVSGCSSPVRSLRALYNLRSVAPGDTVCVDLLPESIEILHYTDACLNFSVVVRGNNSTVLCSQEEDLGTSYSQFPLSFCGGDLVEIRDIYFQGCKRPLLFDEVQTVTVSSANFT